LPPRSRVRWPALLAGVMLIGLAFLAAGRVADTREGLIAEVITLLAGMAGVVLVLYGLFAASGTTRGRTAEPSARVRSTPGRVRSANDLVLGGGGLLIAMILIVGIALTTGPLWGLLGLVLLLPMVVGCAYLCVRFMKAPEREWRIDLQRLTRLR